MKTFKTTMSLIKIIIKYAEENGQRAGPVAILLLTPQLKKAGYNLCFDNNCGSLMFHMCCNGVNVFLALLGVRVTSCSDICLVELGLPPVAAIIKDKQMRFFQTMLRARSTMTDEPFIYCLNLTLNSRNKTARYMTTVLDYQGDVLTLALDRVRDNVLTTTTSKRQAYVLMNPSLSVHNVYTNMDLSVQVPEHQRLAFSRLRVISHNLQIETGRWACIIRENRLCPVVSSKPSST